MGQENKPELVEGWLGTLGIELLSEWDVLVFLYRHRTSLVSAEHVARLLGYATGAVVATLARLEALRMVERSRVSQAVRLYQFIPPDGSPRRGDAWSLQIKKSRGQDYEGGRHTLRIQGAARRVRIR